MYRDRVTLNNGVGKNEIFKLHHYPSGKVAFESSTPSVYLSVNDGGVGVGKIEGAGMGYTGAQFGVMTSEEFHPRCQGVGTNVNLELGIGQRYLRCAPNFDGKPVLNVQGAIAAAETFQICVLPSDLWVVNRGSW